MLFCKKSEEKRVSMLSDTSDSSPFGRFAISQPDQPPQNITTHICNYMSPVALWTHLKSLRT